MRGFLHFSVSSLLRITAYPKSSVSHLRSTCEENTMASGASVSKLLSLAKTISASVAKIEEALSAEEIPSPSFDQDSIFNIPVTVSRDRDIVLDATAELHDLLLEPLNLISKNGGHHNAVCLQAIAEFEIADMVPPHSRTTFGEIAERTPMSEKMTARILRHAMTMRVFCEPEPGFVAHTAASRALYQSASNVWLEVNTKEMWPAATKVSPSSQGYSLSKNSEENIYAITAKDANTAARWARGMAVMAQRPQLRLSHLTDTYDWPALGDEAQVVDVGGGNGHVAIALARRFSNLTVTVQDVEGVIERCSVPEDVQGRIHFGVHDFFTPQPLHGADVYFFRLVFHNWSDKYCGKIIRGLIPALKPGARVLIQDMVMPVPGTVPLWREKELRATDMMVASVFNAQERTVDDFKTLFERIDKSFELGNVIEPEGSDLGIVEFVWKGK
ncbi:S-adenosyl-L-methionine-dependent methyltransferase [Poronia punctata]|nr:S-adenosyl-L-methionine-dependent methyltransferase [Poronia punctata]